MSDNRLRRSLVTDSAILRALPPGDWLAIGAIAVVCGGAGFWLLGPPVGGAALILAALAVVIAACDARLLLVPDVLTVALFVCGLAATTAIVAFAPGASEFGPGWLVALASSLGGAALGGAVLGGLRWLWLRLRGVEAMGLADVKLAAALGAWLGPVDLFTALLVAAVAGLAVAIPARFIGRTPAAGGQRLPFAAFLAPAGWLVFVLVRL